MTHSPEPWGGEELKSIGWAISDRLVIPDANAIPVCACRHDADKERILACINAMKGIEDPERLMDAVRNAVAWRNDMEDASGLHDLIESISECLP